MARDEKHDGSVTQLLYLYETLCEFSAGLAWRSLDSHHGELREKHQSGQERPGQPHDPSGGEKKLQCMIN